MHFIFHTLFTYFLGIYIKSERHRLFNWDTTTIRVWRNMPVAPCCLCTNGSWYVVPTVGVVRARRPCGWLAWKLAWVDYPMHHAGNMLVHCNGVCNNRIASIFTYIRVGYTYTRNARGFTFAKNCHLSIETHFFHWIILS